MTMVTSTARGGSAERTNHRHSWLWSAVAVGIFSLLLNTVLEWHSSATSTNRPALGAVGRRLATDFDIFADYGAFLEQDDPNQINDDITRDKVCSEYLLNFLNGTTDANDVCQGMYTAWEAADCVDDTHNKQEANVMFEVQTDHSEFRIETETIHEDEPTKLARKHNSTNGTVVDDDIVIDDYFENWECCAHISDYYRRNCREHSLNALRLFGICSVLVVCGLLKSLFKQCAEWIPDAAVCCLVGALVSLFVRTGALGGMKQVAQELTFNNDLFLHILLPPIIFQAAVSINKRAFRRDLLPILFYAVGGTFFTAVAIGFMTFHMSHWVATNPLPLLDSLLFGALMSSIDPVATLGILSSVGVSQSDTLYTLIFGESLLNDGVSIVLFDSLVRHMGDSDVVDKATVADTMFHFVLVLVSSIAIGCICGAFCTLYFWALQGKQTAVTEVALFFAWALIPYYIADGLGVSGIISIMVMGFMLDYYVIGGNESDEREWMEYMAMQSCPSNTNDDQHIGEIHSLYPVDPRFDRIKLILGMAFSGRGHILSRSRHHVGFVAEVISNVMETAIFCYLGLFLFYDTVHDIGLTASGMFACVGSRAVMIVLFSALVNAAVWIDLEGCLKRVCRTSSYRGQLEPTAAADEASLVSEPRTYLDVKTQIIMFSAGVRGAVSYALVQNIPVHDAVTKTGSYYKSDLKAMTSATIVALLFAFGGLTYHMVQRDLLRPNRERAARPLTERLMSSLASDDENGEESGDSLSLEIEYPAERQAQPGQLSSRR